MAQTRLSFLDSCPRALCCRYPGDTACKPRTPKSHPKAFPDTTQRVKSTRKRGYLFPLTAHFRCLVETNLHTSTFDVILQSYTYALGGLPVSAVTFGQPAALAGLQKGDVITSVNGTNLRSMDYSKAIHVLNAAFSSNSTHVALDVVR
jgi:hypothetical protein